MPRSHEINTIGGQASGPSTASQDLNEKCKGKPIEIRTVGTDHTQQENCNWADTVSPCICTNRANLLSTTRRSAVALCLRPAGTPATAARKVSETMIWVAKQN